MKPIYQPRITPELAVEAAVALIVKTARHDVDLLTALAAEMEATAIEIGDSVADFGHALENLPVPRSGTKRSQQLAFIKLALAEIAFGAAMDNLSPDHDPQWN